MAKALVKVTASATQPFAVCINLSIGIGKARILPYKTLPSLAPSLSKQKEREGQGSFPLFGDHLASKGAWAWEPFKLLNRLKTFRLLLGATFRKKTAKGSEAFRPPKGCQFAMFHIVPSPTVRAKWITHSNEKTCTMYMTSLVSGKVSLSVTPLKSMYCNDITNWYAESGIRPGFDILKKNSSHQILLRTDIVLVNIEREYAIK